MHSLVRITLRHRRTIPQSVTWLSQSRSVSYLEVERKFLPASDFHRKVDSLCSPRNVPKTERIRDTYYDYSGVLANKGIWIRYRCITSIGTENDLPITDLSSDERWDAKVRLGGDFIESQFEEYQGEQSIRNLLLENVPGTTLEDLAITADLETTRTTWNIRPRVGYLQPDRDAHNDADYLTVALDHVVSLKEERTGSQHFPMFEHLVGEVELIKEVNTTSEHEEITKERNMELDQMNIQIEGFMTDNPGLFSQLKPVGKLSAYFDWEKHALASAV